MKWFNNIGLTSKFILILGLVLVFLAVSIGLSIETLVASKNLTQNLEDTHYQIRHDLLELRANQNWQRSEMLEAIMTSDPAVRQSDIADVTSITADNNTLIKGLDILLSSSANAIPSANFQNEWNQVKQLFTNETTTRATEIQDISGGEIAAASQLAMGTMLTNVDQTHALLLAMDNEIGQQINNLVQANNRQINDSIIVSVIFGGLSLLFLLAIAIVFSLTISKPLKKLSIISDRVSTGDLTQEITETSRKDEVGSLFKSFSVMLVSLREQIKLINEGVNSISSDSNEILAGSTQSASGAVETASAVSQTTSTLEEVRQISESSVAKSKVVAETAAKTVGVAKEGRAAVMETVELMEGVRANVESITASVVHLSEQGQAIGEIIASVNDIADQSNLLAVNASIEAAKAGDYGKGFGVVAQEIKALAEQSKLATTKVRAILLDVQKGTSAAVMATEQGAKTVEMGVKQSQKAGEAIDALNDSVSKASESAVQIAASNQQQMAGMSQVTNAMENIKQSSTQIAASTKQAEIAARNLTDLAHKMKVATAKYIVEKGT